AVTHKILFDGFLWDAARAADGGWMLTNHNESQTLTAKVIGMNGELVQVTQDADGYFHFFDGAEQTSNRWILEDYRSDVHILTDASEEFFDYQNYEIVTLERFSGDWVDEQGGLWHWKYTEGLNDQNGLYASGTKNEWTFKIWKEGDAEPQDSYIDSYSGEEIVATDPNRFFRGSGDFALNYPWNKQVDYRLSFNAAGTELSFDPQQFSFYAGSDAVRIGNSVYQLDGNTLDQLRLYVNAFAGQDAAARTLTVGNLTMDYRIETNDQTGQRTLIVTDAVKGLEYRSEKTGSAQWIDIRGSRYNITGVLHPDSPNFVLTLQSGNAADSQNVTGQVISLEGDLFAVSEKAGSPGSYEFNNGQSVKEGSVGGSVTVNDRLYNLTAGAAGVKLSSDASIHETMRVRFNANGAVYTVEEDPSGSGKLKVTYNGQSFYSNVERTEIEFDKRYLINRLADGTYQFTESEDGVPRVMETALCH
ncbi:MAG: hypothetical protein KDA77_20485, partial [Planctomycetaceae bacterium]|nr:hypothetical protein [Planctomycetaceae bacterium]